MLKPNKSELKKHLLRSVKILKRTLDYTSYCYLIMAMFFFYHVGETPGQYNARSLTQQVIPTRPTSSFTTSFQRKKKNLQDELTEAFSILESLSPRLKGTLLPAIPETPIPDSDLLEYRDQIDLLQQNTGIFGTTEHFGQAYEYWVSQLARMTIKRGVAFYTQRSLVRLMVAIVKPNEGNSIYDPTVGTGGMLIESAAYIQRQGGSLTNTHFYGRENLPDIRAICQMNMLAHQMENTTIEQGDTLQVLHPPSGAVDLVLQNLPLSPDQSNRGLTRRMNAAFLEHAIGSISASGKAAVLAPASILQQDHHDFWHHVLSQDWLEAVISLPPRVLHGTTASATLLVFNKKKPVDRSSSVLFIQLASNYLSHTAFNELQDEDILPVVQAFDSWGNGSNDARIVSLNQIKEQNYSLAIERYPDLVETAAGFDIGAALSRYRSAIQKREAAVQRLMKSLEELQLPDSDG